VALVEAAAAAGVKQFVLVTSLGTGKFGFPAAVLNLFWGVLNEKRKAEEVRVCGREGDSVCGGGGGRTWAVLWEGCATDVVLLVLVLVLASLGSLLLYSTCFGVCSTRSARQRR
jgi:hypothetical protein